MSKELFKFNHNLKVRYYEVDVQNIVFNAHYLSYLDIAWIEYLRNLGLDYGQLFKEKLFDTFIVKSTLEYKSPAYYDEALDIYVRVRELGNKSLTVEYGIYKEDGNTLVLTGEIIYVTFDPNTGTTCPIPLWIREKITAFELNGR